MRSSTALLLVLAVGCESTREIPPGSPVGRASDGGGAADGGVAEADAASADASPTYDCTGVMPVGGLAARCCPDFGVDACGPGLFCAAFDGRTFPVCYAEHARMDGESCAADVHCLSYACASGANVCRSSPGSACTTDVGCGPGPSSNRFVCASGSCRATTGATGAPCGLGADCASTFCVASVCTEGGERDRCASGADCVSGRCAGGLCSSGREGAPCGGPSDCASGFCVNQSCSSGEERRDCRSGADCASGLCVSQRCSAGTNGRGGARANDCAAGLRCVEPCLPGQSCGGECSDGASGSPCGANADCSGGASCAIDFSGAGVCGGSCHGDPSCTDGYVCSGARACVPPGASPAGASCVSDAECASAVCATFGVAGSLCSAPSGYRAPCNGNSCATGFWCENRSGSPDIGRCLPAEDSPCRRFHDSVEIWSATCHSVVSRCARYDGALCEGSTTNCRTDADCGGARCIVTYSCGF